MTGTKQVARRVAPRNDKTKGAFDAALKRPLFHVRSCSSWVDSAFGLAQSRLMRRPHAGDVYAEMRGRDAPATAGEDAGATDVLQA